ncbi:hypothetical protein VTO58DRAFT_100860 [Aureobasidium pullulans]|nr:hypothetical protein JADG_008080 [Aureobasidium pullulans]
MGAWGYDLFQSDDDLDTICLLDESPDLNKVKEKILADPAKYSFKKQPTKAKEGDSASDSDKLDKPMHIQSINIEDF